VMADSASAHAAVSGYDKVLYLPKERKQVREEEHFWSLSVAGSLYAGKFSVLRGYDYTKPRPGSAQIVREQAFAGDPSLARISRTTTIPVDFPKSPTPKPRRRCAWRAATSPIPSSKSRATPWGSGSGTWSRSRSRCQLGDELNPFWDDADFEKEYLITSATYSISINQYETGDVAESDEPFKATYTLLDSQSPFRPRATPTSLASKGRRPPWSWARPATRSTPTSSVG
jgi:uncharacterized protein involved in type VI secretion and phage assembly